MIEMATTAFAAGKPQLTSTPEGDEKDFAANVVAPAAAAGLLKAAGVGLTFDNGSSGDLNLDPKRENMYAGLYKMTTVS